MKITQEIIPKSLWRLKCPHGMTPTYITIHNTANTASAAQEVNYLKRNSAATSCHIFVDEDQAIQCLPLNRNGWHAGDGVNGTGNRRSIGIEICRSTEYTTGWHRQAMLNAAEVVRQLMDKYNIPLDHVVQHNHWTGKNCPHRIRSEGTWQEFLSLCADKSAEEDVLMRIINYKGGSTPARKMATAFFAYARKGTIPRVEYVESTFDGCPVHYMIIHPDNDTMMDLSYAGDRPAYINDLVNQHVLDDGYELIGGMSGGYFDNHPLTDTYGQPIGAVLINWDDRFAKFKGIECSPTKGRGYLTAYSDGYCLDIVDEYDDYFYQSWSGHPYMWAVSGGYRLTKDGKACNDGAAANGRFNSRESVAMLGRRADGAFIYAVCLMPGLTGAQQTQFMLSLQAIESIILDGGGTTHLMVNPQIVNQDPTQAPKPEAPGNPCELYVVTEKSGAYIRQDLKFTNDLPTGTKLILVPRGQQVTVLETLPGIQVDGFQWLRVCYVSAGKTYMGFMQLDTAVLTIVHKKEKEG